MPDNSGENTMTLGSLQYSDRWSPKLRGTLIYSVQNNDKFLNSERYSEQEFSQEQTIRSTTDHLNSGSTSHRLFTDLTYNPDSRTTIMVSPSLDVNNSTRTNQRSEILRFFSNGTEGNPQIQNAQSFNDSEDYRLYGRISVNRKLDTTGRNILFIATIGTNSSEGEESQENELTFFSPVNQSPTDSLQSQQIYSEDDG